MANLSGWRVLLVEDEVDAQDVVVPLLDYHGMKVKTAFSGEEAMEILTHEKPDLVITDLALPNMNGWELLASMRSNPGLADVPAVAITAYHSTNVAQEAIQAGFAAYFPKPISARTFVEDLTSLFE